ncbi:FeoB-associated Cys-rich membrane protein [Oscillospiraceae bacterium LTW-04]|nr:FeoB-associated Cys-rich membrane protein [Oscillospiraceae bacterium MB24-C1]
MFEFLSSNLPTIIVGAIVFTVITMVVVKLIKDKINHKSSCGCGCANCPSASACHHK